MIQPVVTTTDRKIAQGIREEVFVREQGVPPELERDSFDSTAIHILALNAEPTTQEAESATAKADSISPTPAGTARAFPNPENSKELMVGRVAVLKRFRGLGIATRMMEFLLRWARQEGFQAVRLHAQTYIVPLYAKLGFLPEGPVFFEAGIPHQEMRIPL